MTRPASYEDPGDRFASPAYDDWLDKATSHVTGLACHLLDDALKDLPFDSAEKGALHMAVQKVLADECDPARLAAAAVAVGFCEPFEGGE